MLNLRSSAQFFWILLLSSSAWARFIPVSIDGCSQAYWMQKKDMPRTFISFVQTSEASASATQAFAFRLEKGPQSLPQQDFRAQLFKNLSDTSAHTFGRFLELSAAAPAKHLGSTLDLLIRSIKNPRILSKSELSQLGTLASDRLPSTRQLEILAKHSDHYTREQELLSAGASKANMHTDSLLWIGAGPMSIGEFKKNLQRVCLSKHQSSKKKRRPQRPAPVPPLKAKGYWIPPSEGDNLSLFIKGKTYSKNPIASWASATALADGVGSTLGALLRTKLKIAYNVTSSIDESMKHWFITTTFASNNMARGLRAIHQHLSAFSPGLQDLERARSSLKLTLAEQLESPFNQVARAKSDLLYLKRVNYQFDLLDQINKLTMADLKKAAAEIRNVSSHQIFMNSGENDFEKIFKLYGIEKKDTVRWRP